MQTRFITFTADNKKNLIQNIALKSVAWQNNHQDLLLARLSEQNSNAISFLTLVFNDTSSVFVQ